MDSRVKVSSLILIFCSLSALIKLLILQGPCPKKYSKVIVINSMLPCPINRLSVRSPVFYMSNSEKVLRTSEISRFVISFSVWMCSSVITLHESNDKKIVV